jgi:hypothetical protein
MSPSVLLLVACIVVVSVESSDKAVVEVTLELVWVLYRAQFFRDEMFMV